MLRYLYSIVTVGCTSVYLAIWLVSNDIFDNPATCRPYLSLIIRTVLYCPARLPHRLVSWILVTPTNAQFYDLCILLVNFYMFRHCRHLQTNYIITYYIYIYIYIPLQAWTGREVYRRLRLPDFRQSAHESGKVVSPTHRPPLPPRKYSWYSFLFVAESTPGP